jgi:methylated-DNA-[protein]-cysteine S-methyltransferase
MSAAGIYAREFDGLGVLQLGVAGDRVISVSFPGTPPDDATTDHPLFDRVADYLAGSEDHFDDVTVALTLPTDQRRVLESVRNVPYGETISLDRLLRMTPDMDPDSDADHQTARDALATNPVPLFVPDHRIENTPSGAPDSVVRALRRVER